MKKGFQVYYTTNGTFRLKKKISSSNNTCVIYSNDDGINAASKSSTTYVYADESEEKYTKTTVSSSDNVLNVYSGYVNVMIANNETHTITLPVKNGNNNTITYSADRDDNFPLNTASASVSDYKDTEAYVLFWGEAHSTHIHPH